MNEPLDELYLVWLYSQVADTEVVDPSMTHWKLLKQLYTREFVSLVPNDENRLEDGRDLRLEFMDELDVDNVDREWSELGCSMLELMVGLSRKLAFEAEGEPHYWFWHLMDNIGLQKYYDNRRLPRKHVDDVLDRVIYRTYDSDGRGGFFPLDHPRKDQRKVELWYQMSAYVLELSS